MERRTLAVAVCSWIALAAPASAIPSSITYQGSLKQQGLPATGTKNMLFRITNSDGSQVYWSSGNLTVTVNNGLFSARITPTGVDWANVIPYIEVSVEGQLLQPREPVGASAYALMCVAVANESGMIAMFAGNCPTGWTRFTALDNAFPMGGSAYGTTGGSATSNTDSGFVLLSGQGSGSFLASWKTADNFNGRPMSTLPPYVTMVFCQKL